MPQTLPTGHTHLIERDLPWYGDRAKGLLAVIPDGERDALEQVRRWHPAFAGTSDEHIRNAVLTLDDARLVYARQHGFEDWNALGDYLAKLDSDAQGEPFMAAFEAGQRGDWERAAGLLRAHPDLIQARGSNGNTLLNLAASIAANPEHRDMNRRSAEDKAAEGVEHLRLATIRRLLEMGADVNQPNDRGWTPLHQAAYRNDVPMTELFLRAGGRIDLSAHGDGGTPLAIALFWGYREVVDVLAPMGVVPANLRCIAGSGRLDLLQQCFASDGSLTEASRQHRAFYRPHSGFPRWRKTNEPQEILDEALVWAAKSGRVNVLPLLVERGARIDAEPYRGTPLIWAAFNCRLDAIRWLLDHGANVNQRTTFGGMGHGDGVTALHLAAQNGRIKAIDLLVERGADLTIRDNLYGGTPVSWAEHGGNAVAMERLKAAEMRPL